jgi:hypothetical protein
MQTDYPTLEHTPHPIDREIFMESEPPISISHFTHTLQRYRAAILLSLAVVVLAYLIIAIVVFLSTPTEQITAQPFRLDFERAGKGEYPNKTKFNIADIISGPIVMRVWQDNHLGKYIPFGDFSRAVFVLESNKQYDLLAAEYQAKLADPKISSVDRERLQKEFELKSESIAKNEYSINLDRHAGSHSLPEPLARKVLLDILNSWADFAVNQQHVIAYQVSVLSPEVLKPSTIEQSDAVAAIEVLRAKANRVSSNIERIQNLPGATLARTPTDHLSLEEIRIRLDEILRFRLEPLLSLALQNPGLVTDRAETIRFVEGQLAYDQRQLEAAQRLADSVREAMAVYEQRNIPEPMTTTSTAKPLPKNVGSESVMPQLSDTFLDRLLSLTGRSADVQYRQKLVDEYRRAIAETIPLEQAVAYDNQVLEEVRKPQRSGTRGNAAEIRAQIDQTRAEIAQLIDKTNELFQMISRNMTPSTQLFTLTSPPTTHTLRSVSLQRLALYGLLVVLIALPAIIVFCLLHNRVREEEAAEEYLRQEGKLARAETLP